MVHYVRYRYALIFQGLLLFSKCIRDTENFQNTSIASIEIMHYLFPYYFRFTAFSTIQVECPEISVPFPNGTVMEQGWKSGTIDKIQRVQIWLYLFLFQWLKIPFSQSHLTHQKGCLINDIFQFSVPIYASIHLEPGLKPDDLKTEQKTSTNPDPLGPISFLVDVPETLPFDDIVSNVLNQIGLSQKDISSLKGETWGHLGWPQNLPILITL